MKLETKNYKFHFSFPTIIFAIPTAIIGHSIHGSFWWAIFDLLFWPFSWMKWFVYQEVNVTIIKEAFSWFLK
jgi:hypothetical protein|tara:strand:+ start:500 stop:715 length:216 start_codon:yes stop_codon:yes gene_type:complete